MYITRTSRGGSKLGVSSNPAPQALAAAKAALGRLEAAGVPWRRPADYYAEMVKSDAHMARVKAQLMHEQAQIEAADERRAPAEAELVVIKKRLA